VSLQDDELPTQLSHGASNQAVFDGCSELHAGADKIQAALDQKLFVAELGRNNALGCLRSVQCTTSMKVRIREFRK
jgi:hypothetical protein